MSSAFIFNCTEEEKSETGQNHKAEDELCVKSSVSGPHRLENAKKQSLKANHRETSKNDIENFKLDSKTIFHWETNIEKCKTVPGQDVLACASSSITIAPDFEINQIEKCEETCRVNDSKHKDLHLVPPVSSGELMAEAQETCSFNCGEDPRQEQVSCTSTDVSDTLDTVVAGHKTEVIGEGLSWEKDNDSNDSYCRGPCGTSRLALHFTQRNARATVKEPALNDEVNFVGSSRVNFGETELCGTFDENSYLACEDPARVDKHTAVPHNVLQTVPVISGGSKEMVVPSSEDHVLLLSEDTINTSENPSKEDLQSFPEELYLNELSYNPMGGFAGQMFSESLAGGGCQYPVGCLWTNTVVKGELEDKQIFMGDLHSQPQDFKITPFWMEKLHYQLPIAEDGVIWGWQNSSAQLVSVFIVL